MFFVYVAVVEICVLLFGLYWFDFAVVICCVICLFCLVSCVFAGCGLTLF